MSHLYLNPPIHIDGTTPDVPADPDIGSDNLYTAATDAPHYIEIGLNVAGGYTLTIAAAPEGEEACNSMDAEADCDGDNTANLTDTCPRVATVTAGDHADPDEDGMGNVCDLDDDGDAVADIDDDFVLNACASTNSDSAHATNSDVLPDDIIDPTDADAGRCSEDEVVLLINQLAGLSADDSCETVTVMGDVSTARVNCTDTDDDGDGTLNTADVDMDNDGLIDIATAAELNNMRNDLDGSHYDTSTDDSAQSNAGCPSGGCNGYELVATIANLSSTHANWVPIGNNTNKFTATFDGNGFGITELAVSSAAGNVGFFGRVGSAGVVRNLHVAGTLTHTNFGNIGGLAGNNNGTVENSSSSGTVNGGAAGQDIVGGLVGQNNSARSTIRTSWSDATVNGGAGASNLGGLLGSSNNSDSIITDSYATGTLTGGSGNERIGGLSASSGVTNSYATATISGGGGSNTLGGLVPGGRGTPTITASFHTHIGSSNHGTRVTAAELQAPTNAVPGIFSAWSTNNWDFGTASQFPALRGYVDSNGDGDNLDMDEQGQIMCGQPGQTGTPQTRATRPECVGALVPLP